MGTTFVGAEATVAKSVSQNKGPINPMETTANSMKAPNKSLSFSQMECLALIKAKVFPRSAVVIGQLL
jgi:hypothetical protein